MIRRAWGMRRTRGRRVKVGAVSLAVVAAVSGTTPVHAALESAYVMPGTPCIGPYPGNVYQCHAGMEVHLLLPNDYAVCTALAQAGPQGPMECGGTATAEEDAVVDVSAGWDLGSCVSPDFPYGHSWQMNPLLTPEPPGSNTSAPATCSTIDSSYTQTFVMVGCPGTSFTVTADMKGNNDGTFLGSYNVSATGPCAGLFDVFVVEGAHYG